MNNFWLWVTGELLFILGSIIFLYSLWILWGKWSLNKYKKKD